MVGEDQYKQWMQEEDQYKQWMQGEVRWVDPFV